MSELSQSLPPLGSVAIVRSVLISVVLAISLLSALPTRPLLRARELAQPANVHMLALVEGGLGALGIAVSAAAIAESLLASSKRIQRTRRGVVHAVAPLLSELGMRQRWALFTIRSRRAFRLQIEAMHKDQRWQLVYRAHELDRLGLLPKLSFRRLRGIYDPRSENEPRAQYEALVNWLAKDLLVTHPAFIGVRISVQRLRLGSQREPTAVTSVEHVREIYRSGTP
jgi:hypothetical protein